jgi:mRNA-degrading endonuclease toxin of MazEF toxin-antitoxin module
MSHKKDFDLWNVEKKQLNSSVSNTGFYIHEREVWWAAIGVNIGTEMDGKNEQHERPVLIVRKLGKEQFLGIPLTSRAKEGVFYIPISYNDRMGTACISQVRVMSVHRLLRKIGRTKTEDFNIVVQQLSKLIATGKL